MIAVLGPALPAAALARPLPEASVVASLPAASASPATPVPEGQVANGSSGTGAQAGLALVSQTSWVRPGQMFDLNLSIGSTVARSQLGIALSVYAPPDGQSSFDQTLQGNTSSESLVSDTQTVPLQSLSTNSSGDVVVRAAISAGNYSAPPATFDLDLQCAPENCNGVYPLRVQLMDTATGSVVSDLVTYILFIESSITSRLRVALVVPLGSEPSEPGDTGVPGPPKGSALSDLETSVTELQNSSAAVTAYPQPETVQGAGDGSAEARSVEEGIVTLSDEAAVQVLPSTYVWVDPKTLVDAGLSGEIVSQLRRGAQVMAAARVQTSGNTTLVEGGLDDQTLQALSDTGTEQVVVPSADVAPVTGRFAGPSVQTFTLRLSKGRTMDAVQTDPDLESELTSGQDGNAAVLGAHQLLADLALVAFEEPEAGWTRGVVLAPPLGWSPSPGFLPALLTGLAGIPVLDPVTLSSFFAQVSRGDDGGISDNGNGWPSTRRLVNTPGPAQAFPAAAVSDALSRLSGLESVVDAGENLTALGDLRLSAESVLLSTQQQTALLSALDAVVAKRAEVVSLTAVHTFRLTSRTATIPITLVRQVPYPVTVVLDLSSDKLAFLHGTNPQKVTLTQHIQTVDVDVFARTSGDFPVVVSLKSPTGGLVIASAQFTVRSLSTSLVAILLTVVAAAVLLVWWARTLMAGRRGRRARGNHGAHSASRREEPTPAGAEAGAPGSPP
ncbi:MAG: DUF6049 family protein [Acidimicrobiales bacterium]